MSWRLVLQCWNKYETRAEAYVTIQWTGDQLGGKRWYKIIYTFELYIKTYWLLQKQFEWLRGCTFVESCPWGNRDFADCCWQLPAIPILALSTALPAGGMSVKCDSRFQHMSQNCLLTVYEHSSRMVCYLKESTPTSRLMWWQRFTVPHQHGGSLHLLMTMVAWRHFTTTVPGSATATTNHHC